MKFRIMLLLYGILQILFGIPFLFVPEMGMAPFLINPPLADFLLLTRMFGTYHLLLGVLCFVFREISEPATKKKIAWLLAIGPFINLILFILGINSGVLTQPSYTMVVITALFTAGFVSSALRKEP